MKYPNKLNIGERLFDVEYESVSKLSSSVRIRKGKIVVRLSRFLRGRKRDETVEKFLKWSVKKLDGFSDDFIEPNYEDGGRISTHNKVYELNIYDEKRKNARVVLKDGYIIEIFLNEEMNDEERSKKVKFLVQKIIMKDQSEYLEEVLNELNDLHFKKRFRDCRFKRVNSRFGSCSSKGSINIAYRLLFAPREVFRYVCVHELAHLKEFNHSKKFWGLVGEAMPDYRSQEKWLKKNGFMLG